MRIEDAARLLREQQTGFLDRIEASHRDALSHIERVAANSIMTPAQIEAIVKVAIGSRECGDVFVNPADGQVYRCTREWRHSAQHRGGGLTWGG